jgi:HTTM domain
LRPLFAPTDVASLALFRIAFGAILLWEVWKYFTPGWIELTFLRPHFRFTYPGLAWLPL